MHRLQHGGPGENPSGRPLLPAVQVLGPAVQLPGPAVLEVLRALRTHEHALRANGTQAPPSLLALQRAFAIASSVIQGQAEPMSHPRQRDATSDAAQQHSTSEAQIGSREAAELLGVTTRQVQRLATTLDGRRLSNGHLIFDRLAVQAYALAVHDNRRTAA